MKDVQMSFRIEPELRASFTQVTEAEHRPAAQVLRELMRGYVEQSSQRLAAKPVPEPISVAERQRRQKAVDFARASIGLEGFRTSVQDEDRARRFIDGEISLAEFTKVGLGHD